MGGDHDDYCGKCGHTGWHGMGCPQCREVEAEHAPKPRKPNRWIGPVFNLVILGFAIWAIVLSFEVTYKTGFVDGLKRAIELDRLDGLR